MLSGQVVNNSDQESRISDDERDPVDDDSDFDSDSMVEELAGAMS